VLESSALAQEGIYVGLGLGSFDYSEDAAFLAPEPFEDTASTWKVYGGFEFGDHFGFEIRYGATDEIEQTLTGTDPFFGDFSAVFDTDFAITTALAMGMLPKDWGTPYAGIGYFDITANADLTLTTDCCGTFTSDTSLDDTGLAAVLGIEWRFGRFGTGIGVRLEYEWLDVDGGDASTLGVGVAYRF
jgi:opacity protein-like surface antigen